MDILEIDAVNFAGRVAHVAAAELYGLLLHGEVKPEPCWFMVDDIEAEEIDQKIDAMAAYVAKRRCAGEQLFRAHTRSCPWEEENPWRHAAFDLFSSTVTIVAAQLLKRQAQAERALDLATRPTPAPVKLEDTIFEPEEGLGKLRPEAVDAQAQIATYDQAQAAAKAEPEAGARETPPDQMPAETAPAVERRAKPKQKSGQTIAEPMSVGEAPATPPVNRGGRGNKKNRT